MNFSANEPDPLPGLDLEPVTPTPTCEGSVPTRPRVKPVDRSQLTWQMLDVERLIEEDHPARAIWTLTGRLNLQGFYAPIEAVEGNAGRAPWDPRLLVSLWIYAYSRGISSAREIARRCTYEPAFQWLCGLGAVNHHTLSDFRVAHDASLRELFVQVLGVLSVEGLVSLERVMHDGTRIKACAGADSFRRQKSLEEHLQAAREQVQAMADSPEEEASARQQAARERAARERENRLAEALKELQEIQKTKRPEEKAEARVSQTDPQARIMKQSGGGYAPGYNAQLSTEASHRIIVGVGLSQSGSDFGELIGAVTRVEQNLGAKPAQMVVDGGFTSRENLMALTEQGVDLIGSLNEGHGQKAQRQKRGVSEEFSSDKFTYDPEHDTYRCPAGELLRHSGRDFRRGLTFHQYRASTEKCRACEFGAKCCPGNVYHGRTLTRKEDSPVLRQFREKMQTEQAKSIYRERGAVAEFPNAWIKDKIGLRQFRLRGLLKAGLELVWACLAYNIQQWVRLSWRPGLAVANN